MNVSAAFYNTWSIMLTELTPKIYRIKCLLFISNTLLLESTTTELCTMVCLYVLRICYGKLWHSISTHHDVFKKSSILGGFSPLPFMTLSPVPRKRLSFDLIFSRTSARSLHHVQSHCVAMHLTYCFPGNLALQSKRHYFFFPCSIYS